MQQLSLKRLSNLSNLKTYAGISSSLGPLALPQPCALGPGTGLVAACPWIRAVVAGFNANEPNDRTD